MSRVLPILFNTEMVRAIMDGRKTVTRRIAKKIPVETHRIEINDSIETFKGVKCKKFECHWGGYQTDTESFVDGMCIVKPPCQPGDILYVRETWAFLPCMDCTREGTNCGRTCVTYEDRDSVSDGCFVYRADHPHPEHVSWSPSIHMPKAAARTWLKVKDVRVERLKDIDDAGAYDEGAGHADWIYQNGARRCEFKKLWNSTIKKSDHVRYGWDANPWVWVIEFERCNL